MAHVVLLGDSIFDNARYVAPGMQVVAQLQDRLGAAHRASLLAIDGSVLAGMAAQVRGIGSLAQPATHLVVSCGGNDVLGLVGAMQTPVRSVLEGAELLAAWQADFRRDYRAMLDLVAATGTPLAVATIYDAVPGLTAGLRSALALFNDVIVREAAARQLAVVDLRLVCDRPTDYAAASPIEPSAEGGRKIAAVLADMVLADMVLAGHPGAARTVIHGGGRSGAG